MFKTKAILIEMFVLGENYDMAQNPPNRAHPNVHRQPMVEVGSLGSFGGRKENRT